ncbi:MAG: glycosyltransferase [Casimicrobiaceae bacterium]
MALPLVSIVIRSMARPSLPAALAYVGAQTYASLDVVVVAACGAAHPALPPTAGPHSLRLVASPVTLSRPEAANAGIVAARGDWITFFDDDDEIDPTHVAGLAAVTQRSKCAVICSLARQRLADGSTHQWGQPFSLTELYVRNFLHLSTVLFSRVMLDAGCRFDVAFDIMQDWDFFLQMSQHTPFHSTGLRTFQWNADAGTSGTGGNANSDVDKFARYRDRIYAKWGPQRNALYMRIDPLLTAAGAAIAAGNLQIAQQHCEAVLAIARNEPFALDMLAMLLDRSGRREEAIAMESLATSVQPYEPRFVFNLAALVLGRGEPERARRLAQHALDLDPAYAPAQQMLATLGSR